MTHHGFIRLAAAVPPVRVADPAENARRHLELLGRAPGAALVAFPELGLTGYTCHDLFHHDALLRQSAEALEWFAGRAARAFDGVAVVGLPVRLDDQIFNAAAVCSRGRVIGVVPKSYLPNYGEFYEARYFAAAATARSDRLVLPSGAVVPFGTDLLFACPAFTFGVEICEDLWGPLPPSSWQAAAGATVLVNLSASNELIGKAAYRRSLVNGQAGRCSAAYLYCSSGVHESTTDVVFGGHCLISENGTVLAESARFEREAFLIQADADVDRLTSGRQTTTTFSQAALYVEPPAFRAVPFEYEPAAPVELLREVEAHPFVPRGEANLRPRCEEIFQIQVAGLAKRLGHIAGDGRPPRVTIGVSGGLDSTLALLVTCKTFDVLGWPRDRILGFTLPGFGTTERTRTNAQDLMRQLGVTAREIDIRPLCLAEWRALGHAPFGIDLTGHTVESLAARLADLPPERRGDLVFENVQARVRTNLLMNAGFVIGTGDLSELALGWCTYNADHMSMYGVNVSVPKTLVKFLVRWAAAHEFAGAVEATLNDIVATLISPELLPANSRGEVQSTEANIGPYELHDFFLYHFLRYGAPPEKILYLARRAKFDREYSSQEIRRWLRLFLIRFFANQFKRSCLPDGPKVGTVSLSPRGDWRMPSDAHVTAWLSAIDIDEPRT